MKMKNDIRYLYVISGTAKWIDKETMESLKADSQRNNRKQVSIMMKSSKSHIVFYDRCVAQMTATDYNPETDEKLRYDERADKEYGKYLLSINKIFNELRAKGYSLEEMHESEYIKIEDVEAWKQKQILERI